MHTHRVRACALPGGYASKERTGKVPEMRCLTLLIPACDFSTEVEAGVVQKAKALPEVDVPVLDDKAILLKRQTWWCQGPGRSDGASDITNKCRTRPRRSQEINDLSLTEVLVGNGCCNTSKK
eukprot:418601-Pelagomonas_calceolata.AAC.7